MARFSRPEKTIRNAYELKFGDHIWHVYGIWPPYFAGEEIVTGTARRFHLHDEYSSIHHGAADRVVFDTRYINEKRSTMNFARDSNMEYGAASHSDNYYFRSKEDAEAAVAYFTECWKADPNMVTDELERRKIESLCKED
jgi:hypothetical protein